MKRILTVVAVAGGLCLSANAASEKCRVSGSISGFPDDNHIFVVDAHENFRVVTPVAVPITDGKFSFELPADTVRWYSILLNSELRKGSWRNRRFFAQGDSVVLNIGVDNVFDVISDAPENRLVTSFDKSFKEQYGALEDSLSTEITRMLNHGGIFVPPMEALYRKYNASVDKSERDSLLTELTALQDSLGPNAYSKPYSRACTGIEKIHATRDSLLMHYLADNVSIYGLSTIKNKLTHDSPDQAKWVDLYERSYKNKKAMSWHPYAADIEVLIQSKRIVPGEIYPDLLLHRPDGSSEQVADLVKDGPAVIDLWASWCGPCRRHSMELIPVFEKYAPKGFKVVAVAREDGDLGAMNNAMASDKYPWESFVDICDRDKIWARNGAGNAGGRIVLVDKDRRIVAVDVEISEVAKYLEGLYGE